MPCLYTIEILSNKPIQGVSKEIAQVTRKRKRGRGREREKEKEREREREKVNGVLHKVLNFSPIQMEKVISELFCVACLLHQEKEEMGGGCWRERRGVLHKS